MISFFLLLRDPCPELPLPALVPTARQSASRPDQKTRQLPNEMKETDLQRENQSQLCWFSHRFVEQMLSVLLQILRRISELHSQSKKQPF
jgi:hypothetical protein